MRVILLLFIASLSTFSYAQTWSYVGPCCIESDVDGLSSAGSEDLDFLSDGTPVVSFFRQTGGATIGKVRQFNGGAWEQVGGDLPAAGTISAIDLETHGGNIYVSILTGTSQISVYTFDGTDWMQVGSTVTGNLAYDFIVDNDGTLYLFTTLDQSIRKFNGTDWEVVLNFGVSSFLQWTSDQSIVIDSNNDMYFYQSFLNGATFIFENYVYKFNGTTTEQVGNMVFDGFGSVGKLGVDGDDNIYAQYSSDGTNKITKLEGTNWNQLLDTTNAANGIFGFLYAFNSDNKMLLSTFTQVYYADGYVALPELPLTGLPIAINNMVLAPDGNIYISFGEIPAGTGSNFSVMVLDEGVAIHDLQNNAIQVYPNPSSGECNVSGLSSGDILQLFDFTGRILYSEVFYGSGMSTFHVNAAPGSYYLFIQRGSERFGKCVQITGIK